MKKLIALSALTFASTLFAADVAYSPPVGGMQITFQPGSRFTGMSLVNPAAYRGAVASASGSVIILSGSGNVGDTLTASGAYFVELTSGTPNTYVGDRFEVDVAATKASGNNTITIQASSARNTLPNVPSGTMLAGYSIVVRPHVTLGQLLGTKENQIMNGSTVVSAADQVLLFDSQQQKFDTYYFLRNGTGSVANWALVGGGVTNRDNVVIPPGTGMVVVRNSQTPVTVTWLGEVRQNNFSQPLVAGNNLVAQPFPIPGSPASRQMTVANGMTGSTTVNTADKIQFPVNGVFATYFLVRNASGTIERWSLVGSSVDQSNQMLFPANGAVIINKINADPNYVVPYTL